MKSVSLNAVPRAQSRRSGSKKVRKSGNIPAVIYGRQQGPQTLEVSAKEMENLIHHAASENLLVDLSVSGDARAKRLALVQEIQHHALSGKMLHVDFHEVAENEKVSIMVPVETSGEASGVKNAGGILEHVLFKIKVRALPKDLPEVITLDVSGLEIGQAIHIGDIKPPEGVEILGDKHISVVAVAVPLTEAQETAAAEGAAGSTDVEMIKEKKEDGTEAAGKAAPAAKGAAKAPADKAAPAAKAGDKGAEKKPEKKK